VNALSIRCRPAKFLEITAAALWNRDGSMTCLAETSTLYCDSLALRSAMSGSSLAESGMAFEMVFSSCFHRQRRSQPSAGSGPHLSSSAACSCCPEAASGSV